MKLEFAHQPNIMYGLLAKKLCHRHTNKQMFPNASFKVMCCPSKYPRPQLIRIEQVTPLKHLQQIIGIVNHCLRYIATACATSLYLEQLLALATHGHKDEPMHLLPSSDGDIRIFLAMALCSSLTQLYCIASLGCNSTSVKG